MVENLKEYIKNPFVWAALICAALIFSGAVKPSSRNGFNCLVQKPNAFYGVISSNPVKTSSGKYYSMNVSVFKAWNLVSGISSSCNGKIKVLVPSGIVESLYPGKLYSLAKNKGVLVEKNEPVLFTGNYYADSGNILVSSIENADSGALDYSEIRFENGIFFVKHKSLSNKTSLKNWLYHKRAIGRLKLKRLLYRWGNAGGLILSLLSGSREYLEESLSFGFKKAGLSHILALSGMHLGFFYLIGSFVGEKIAGKKWSILISYPLLVVYIFFVGLTPSLFRSFLFISLIIMSKKVYCMRINPFELLCFVFLIHACVRPSDLMEVSFMLSYGALSGILLLSSFIQKWVQRIMPKYVAASFSASLSAQSFTFPVTARFFGEVMPIGTVSAIFVTPLISVFMGVSLFGIIICLIMPFLTGPFGCIMNGMYRVICFIVGIFARVPSLTI